MCTNVRGGINMDIFKKHADTLIIIGSIVSSCLWINGKFNEVDKDISIVRLEMAYIKQEIAVLKAVLIVNYP